MLTYVLMTHVSNLKRAILLWKTQYDNFKEVECTSFLICVFL